MRAYMFIIAELSFYRFTIVMPTAVMTSTSLYVALMLMHNYLEYRNGMKTRTAVTMLFNDHKDDE